MTTDGALERPGPWACLLHCGSEQRPVYQHSRDGQGRSPGWSSDSGVKAQGKGETEEPSNSVLCGGHQAGATEDKAPSLLTLQGSQALRSAKSTRPPVLSVGLALAEVAAGLQTGMVSGTPGGGSVCQEAFTLVLTEGLPSGCRRWWAGHAGPTSRRETPGQ